MVDDWELIFSEYQNRANQMLMPDFHYRNFMIGSKTADDRIPFYQRK
jgi:hypothetical protein